MSEPPTLLPKTGDPLTLENRPLESPFSVELPSEIWLVVLENLETDHDALRACSLLNNKFNLLSNPLLWRAITLPIYYRGHTEKLWPRLFALLARPERLRSIRKLAVVFHPHEDNPPSEPIDAYIAILNECNRLIRDVVEKYRLNGTLDPVELPWRMDFALALTVEKVFSRMRKVDTLDISFITPSIMAHDNCSKSSECGLSCSCATRNLPSARPAGAGAAAHMRGEQWHVFAWCSVFIRSLRNFRIQHLQLLHLPTAETKDLFSPSLLHLFTSLANIKIVPGAREEADFEPFNDLRFPVPTTRSPLRLRTIVFGAAELLACNDFNSLTLCDNGPGFSLDHLAGTQEENRSLDQLGLAMHQRHLQVLHLDLWRSDRESIADVIQRLRPEGSRISVISECIHTYECYAPKAPAPAPAKCCRAANWTTISEIFQVVPWLKTYVLRQGALPMQYGLGKLRKLKTRRQFLSFIKLGFGNVSLDRAGLRVIFEFGKPPAWATSTRSGQMTAGRWFAFVFERMPDGEWELYDDESGTMCDEDSRDAFYLTPPSSRLPRKKRREIKQEREEAENGITPGSSSATGLLPPPNLVVA